MALTKVQAGMVEATGTPSSSTFLRGDGAWAAPASSITSGTAQATTSGTFKDFTDIPSTAKRVTVMFSAVSVTGATGIKLIMGTSSSLETSGYTWWISTNGASSAGNTAYFQPGLRNTAASAHYGTLVLTLLNPITNLWVLQQSTTAGPDSADVWTAVGSKALSGTLTRLQLASIDGTSTFDGGVTNILWE